MKVLYTSGDGSTPCWARTQPVLEQYCERVGATLVNLPRSGHTDARWSSLDAMERSLEQEAETPGGTYVWMDSDILFNPATAPDIWSELDDRLFVEHHDRRDHVHPSWASQHEEFGVPNQHPYPITAIVRWSVRHAEAIVGAMKAYGADILLLPRRLNDQDALALFAYESETAWFCMPQRWHSMAGAFKDDTVFFHAAGAEKERKMELAQQIIDRVGAE